MESAGSQALVRRRVRRVTTLRTWSTSSTRHDGLGRRTNTRTHQESLALWCRRLGSAVASVAPLGRALKRLEHLVEREAADLLTEPGSTNAKSATIPTSMN